MLEELESQRPRVEEYRNALLSPAWTDVIQPIIRRRTEAIGREMLAAAREFKSEAVVAMGQRILELEWLGNHMLAVVEEFDKQWRAAQDEATADEEAAAYEQELVDVGRTNPYNVVQNPAEEVDPDE